MEQTKIPDRGGAGDFRQGPHRGLRNRTIPYMVFLVGVLGLAGLIVTGALSSTMTLGPEAPHFPRWTDGNSALNNHSGSPGHRGPLLSYSFQPWGGMVYEVPGRVITTGPPSGLFGPVPKAPDCMKWNRGMSGKGPEEILARKQVMPLADGRNL